MLPYALTFGALGLTGAIWIGRRWALSRASRDRAFEPFPGEEAAVVLDDDQPGPLRRWLELAGFRSPSAPTVFVSATLLLVLFASTLASYALATGTVVRTARLVARIPAGLGEILMPLVYLAPWILVLLFGSIPWIIVRAARRRRVDQSDQDLPITLELLATLGDAGLGFDAALDRILQSQSPDRPLAEEFRVFQVELLAGRSRVDCLRRLGRRLNVPSLTVLISALVQADQVGAGIADVLRRQSDDLRSSRRERAFAQAAALPVKLLFPLVICFLPGILVFTLGPSMHQVFQLLDGLFQNRGLR